MAHKSSKPRGINNAPIKLNSGFKQTFFGYYDVSPFSSDNRRLLACAVDSKNRTPLPSDQLTVGFFDLSDTNRFHIIGSTNTWCWQQGCRLQWYPDDDDEHVIYNTLIGERYGSVIQNIHSKEIVKRFDLPVYDIDKTGRFALSLNFSRLHRLRPGYGYVNLFDTSKADRIPNYDGVWLMNLDTGQQRLLIDLETLSKIEPSDMMEGAEHYINHLKFNPSGTRFMFFHLWMKNGVRFSRLFTSNLDGGQLCLLANEGMVSHYTWRDDNKLLVFSRHESTGERYHLYEDMTEERSVFGEHLLRSDGHPSFHPKGDALLTDTYPDKYSDRKILLYAPKGCLWTLGSFYSPLSYMAELRCDLHPRWDRYGDWVCFDSAHEGYRNLYIIQPDEL